MKNAKRLAALFLTAAVLLTAGCSRKTVTSQSSVWFIAKSTNTEFWKSAFAGANAAKSEYNVDLTIMDLNGDVTTFANVIDDIVAMKPDGVITCGLETSTLGIHVKTLQDAGIPVLTDADVAKL